MKELGYSRQKNRKTEQVGEPDSDQDVQFEFIHSETDKSLQDGIPVISVETKKTSATSKMMVQSTRHQDSHVWCLTMISSYRNLVKWLLTESENERRD